MTIYWFEHPDDVINTVPHADQFSTWKDRLTPVQIDAIYDQFDKVISRRVEDEDKILTSNWLPSELCHDGGLEWGGTPFWPIYETACRQNWQQAGWCFGLLLWDYMMQREDDWICGKFDKDGVPIGGTTYFEKAK